MSSIHKDKTQEEYESEKLIKFLKAKINKLEIKTFRDHKLRIFTLDFISKNEETILDSFLDEKISLV